MSFTLNDGAALDPISDLFDLEDFPLADFIPTDQLATVFEGLYYVSADSFVEGDNLKISARLAFAGELALGIPGSNAFQLVLASGGVGWTTFEVEITIGPDLAFRFVDVPLSLRISESILKDVASDGPSELSVTGSLSFSADGISLETTAGVSLAPAYLASTEIIVEAEDVRPVFGFNAPGWLDEGSVFRGITIDELSVTIPPEYLNLDSGSLEIILSKAAIGSTGFSGDVSLSSADLTAPVTGTFLGFPFRFREFNLDIVQNSLIDLSLGLDVRLDKFEDGSGEKWVAIDFAFGQNGTLTGSMASVQPEEAASGTDYPVDVEFAQVMRLGISAIRVTRDEDGLWAFYFSGGMELLIDGATWPEIEFDEFGINSDGKFLMPDGSGIVFASPLVVEWHFATLTVDKFRLGYAEDSDSELELSLSAEVSLIEGVPAGGAVEGLIVSWEPGSGNDPQVRFDGIGITFGVPGSFYADISVYYSNDAGAIEFRGNGLLELPALDMSVDVGIVVGQDGFTYLYLFADAKLMPTGIPIGSTGLSIYGFQGLLAYNMSLSIDANLPEDERYYELFTRSPVGITDVSKWDKDQGQNAMGFGVVLGTVDKGFLLNAKGLFVVAFPDITLLLQARANFLKVRPELNSTESGTLDALLVYASGQSTISLDIATNWEVPVLYSVNGTARAFFDFDDPSAWYLALGEDEEGKRITAQVLYWGGGWLFNAGYWFRLDNQLMTTGIKIEVGLRAEAGGFWVEASGWAYGEMSLFFEPFQWEGLLSLGGRVGAGYKGVSISIEFEGNARARVFEPFDVYIEVSACINALFWDICKSFDFEWEKDIAPALESPLRDWAATPRHWTPKDESVGNTAALDTGVVQLATGTSVTPIPPHSVISLDFGKPMVDQTNQFNEAVALNNSGYFTVGSKSGYSARFELNALKVIRDPDGDAEQINIWGTWAQETLEPNSTLRLMSSERFGDDGSSTNGWLTHMFLDYCDQAEDTVICVDLGEIQPGYGWLDDGSLYHWETDDGAPREDGELEPGDILTIRPPTPAGDYTVSTDDSGDNGEGNYDGDKPGDNGSDGDCKPHSPPPSELAPCGLLSCLCRIPVCRFLRPALWALAVSVLFLLLSLLFNLIPHALVFISFLTTAFAFLLVGLRWLCECGWRIPWVKKLLLVCDRALPQKNSPDPDNHHHEHNQQGIHYMDTISGGYESHNSSTQGTGTYDGGANTGINEQTEVPVYTDSGDGTIVVYGDDTDGRTLKEFCYPLGHGSRSNWGEISQRGGNKTTHESWTVPAEEMVFQPGQTYELQLEYTAKLKDKSGSVSTPLGSNIEVTARFKADDPPDYTGALDNYITQVYPSNGLRPVYRGYDFFLQFAESYVPYLYTAVGAQLVIRLKDAHGDLVKNESGEAILVPASTEGAVKRSVAEQTWQEIYLYNIDEGCIEGPSDYTESGETILLVSAEEAFTLTPNSQYIAELVSVQDADTVLHTWSFTTSRYETFTNLVSDVREVLSSHTALSTFVGTDFDSVCRQAGVNTVAYVENFQITPVLSNDKTSCVALLFESPEPLEFSNRLEVKVNGELCTAVANVDETRGFIMPGSGDYGIGLIEVALTWQRDTEDMVGGKVPSLAVGGDTSDELVEFDIDLTEG